MNKFYNNVFCLISLFEKFRQKKKINRKKFKPLKIF